MLDLESTEALQPEPTLANTLRAVADAEMPARFYQVLQLALPSAYQLWGFGWHRSATLMVAVSAFGVWALCEQQRTSLENGARTARMVGGVRRLAGAIATLTLCGLALETFLRLMGIVFRCPGCAG